MGSALIRRALAVAFSICAASAHAQTIAEGSGAGRPPQGLHSLAKAKFNLGKVDAAFTFSNAAFGTGGVGLRNRREGGIGISGVSGSVKKALLYWAVITQGPPNSTASRLLVKYGGGNGKFVQVNGKAVGSGASPCWTGDQTTVYRGTLPSSLAKGNGLYIIRVDGQSGANFSGVSPWDSSEPPMFEGASLIFVGAGESTVAIYDKGLSGQMFYDSLSYKIVSPTGLSQADQILFHTIGADGQSGVGVEQVAETSAEVTLLNNRRVAGPESGNEGDWNGGAATPLPQLWDNRTYNITAAAKAGSGNLAFEVRAPDDCLVTVANILSVRKP